MSTAGITAAAAGTRSTGRSASCRHTPPAAPEAEQAFTPSASTAASHTTYTVREMRPAQSLWGIAEKELGDGERWREIADLNKGRTMTDGTTFHANSFLQPGWQLHMPNPSPDVAGLRTQAGETAPAADENSDHTVTVHSGDYLSKIAEEELGDGDQWPELFTASKNTPQPHGLPPITDPDIIRPGQQVTVPGAPPDRPSTNPDRDDEAGSHKRP